MYFNLVPQNRKVLFYAEHLELFWPLERDIIQDSGN